MENRVAIIGAGISGLVTCKYLVEKGFHPTIFEAGERIGGVWKQTYESTRLQNTQEAYKFSDFPWPSSVKDVFPINTQVLDYVESYAKHFGLVSYVRFNSKVVGIEYVGESEEEMKSWELWSGIGKPFGGRGKWNLKVQHSGSSSSEEYCFGFLILCIGRFSGLANIPQFPPGEGPEIFQGKVMHSMEYSAMEKGDAAKLIKGKRIAIIGSQKSAIDLASECANANGATYPCTIIQRTVHWAFPSEYVWGVVLAMVYLNRFAELMVHKPGETFLYSTLATLLSPLRWGISRLVEGCIRWKLPLKKYEMIPEHDISQDVSSCQVTFLPVNFYEEVEKGSIIFKKSKGLMRFYEKGLIVNGEVEHLLEADLIILATGYKGDEKLKNMFLSPIFQNYILDSPTSIVPLYRQIIHPHIPNLAIIGYSQSLATIYTTEIRCQWLAHLLSGTFELPSIGTMKKEVEMWESYMKKYGGRNGYKILCLGVVHAWYNDELCRDIGCETRRKKGFFEDLIVPYGSDDYANLKPQ